MSTPWVNPNQALIEGVPLTLGTVAATGVAGQTFTYQSQFGRRSLGVQATQAGGVGSTISGQLEASLDGTYFFAVGSALALGGSTAANGAVASVDGLMGAILRLNITAYTAGSGVTGAAISVLLG